MHRGKQPGRFTEHLCYMEPDIDLVGQAVLLARFLYMNGKKNKFIMGAFAVILSVALVVAVFRDWLSALLALTVGMIIAAIFIWR